MSQQQQQQAQRQESARFPWWGTVGWVLAAFVALAWAVEQGRGIKPLGAVILLVGMAAGVTGVGVWWERARRR